MFNYLIAGSILADFETLLHYIIKQNGVPVGDRHSLFKMQTLPTLNALLTNPIQQDQQRPLQKNFPHLQALNGLLRFSGLARVVHKKKRISPRFKKTQNRHCFTALVVTHNNHQKPRS